jgi:hypothetical protein
MPAPKGHPPYPGCEKGASFGYLGRGEDYYTDQELKELGEGVVAWIQDKHNIWLKYYFAPKGILWDTVQRLAARSPMFKRYLSIAKEIQEAKLCTEPYYRKADGNHARFMLARHHKGEWQDKENGLEETNDLLKTIAEEIKNSHNPVIEE